MKHLSMFHGILLIIISSNSVSGLADRDIYPKASLGRFQSAEYQ